MLTLMLFGVLSLGRADFSLVTVDEPKFDVIAKYDTLTYNMAIANNKNLLVGSDPVALKERAQREGKLWCIGPFEEELFPDNGILRIKPKLSVKTICGPNGCYQIYDEPDQDIMPYQEIYQNEPQFYSIPYQSCPTCR